MRTFAIAVLLSIVGVCVGQQSDFVGKSAPVALTQPADGLDTVRIACKAMEPETRAKTEACQYVATHPKTAPQQPCSDCKLPSWVPEAKVTAVAVIDPQSAPLKCQKYEHVYSFCDEQKRMAPNTGPCFDDGPPRCVPDLHTVTEKEWQELMERLRRLEHPPISSTMPFVPDAK